MTDVVAVTGAEGFIGSHLVEALVQRGCRVRAMVLYNMWSSAAWLDTLDQDVLDHVEVVFGDVRDPASARELVDGAEIVYHLAAIGSVPYSYRAPRSFVVAGETGGGCWNGSTSNRVPPGIGSSAARRRVFADAGRSHPARQCPRPEARPRAAP